MAFIWKPSYQHKGNLSRALYAIRHGMPMTTIYVHNLFLSALTRRRFAFIALSICIARFFVFTVPVEAEQLGTLNTKDVSIFYEQSLIGPAHEIARLFPPVKKELEILLRLPVDFRPAVILVSNEAAFEQIVGNRLIVAYAVPDKMLMVIDYARSSKDPFNMRIILKHELCHLLLHRSIHSLPRWLDEGVAQWASGGFAELFSEKRESYLSWAAISGGLISLNAMDNSFPQDEQGLVLAYEESRSLVDYIVFRYGENGITNILTALKNGKSTKDAVMISLGTPLPELEKDWRQSIRTWSAMLVFIMGNIYSIIFFLAALATVAGYVRYRIKRRRFLEAEEEIFPENP
jgi:hypothetical protein